jgi:hypothetical protein
MKDFLSIAPVVTGFIAAVTSVLFLKDDENNPGFLDFLIKPLKPRWVNILNRFFWILSIGLFLALVINCMPEGNLFALSLMAAIMLIIWVVCILLICWVVYGLFSLIKNIRQVVKFFIQWFIGNND